MPANERRANFLVGPVRLYLVRLPDDPNHLAEVAGGVCLSGIDRVACRALWAPDLWDKWVTHPALQRPVHLHVDAVLTEAGLELTLGAMVPLRELPREAWASMMEGEEWRQNVPPDDLFGPLVIGKVIRPRAELVFRESFHREVLDVLGRAFRGEAVNEWTG
jgi:hypothetical protein